MGFQLPAEPEPEPPKLTPMEQTALLERQRREQQRSYDYLRSWVRPKKVNGVWTLLFGPRLSSYGSSTDMEAAEALAAQAESMKPVPGTGTQQEKVTDGSAAGDDPSTARRPFLREMRNRTCGQICSRPLVASLLTPQNLLLVASMGVFNLFSTFYLTSHQDDFELIFSADTAAELNQKLDLSFPLVGFFASFVFMFLFAAVPAEAPFIMVFCLNTSWAILYMIPDIVTQHIAAFLFGLVRVLNWASFYHYISSNSFLYKAHLVGRCLGYNGALIAVIGDASAPILAKYLAAGSWLSTSTRFLAGKVLLLAIQLPIGIALPWVVRKARLKNEEVRRHGHVAVFIAGRALVGCPHAPASGRKLSTARVQRRQLPLRTSGRCHGWTRVCGMRALCISIHRRSYPAGIEPAISTTGVAPSSQRL